MKNGSRIQAGKQGAAYRTPSPFRYRKALQVTTGRIKKPVVKNWSGSSNSFSNKTN